MAINDSSTLLSTVFETTNSQPGTTFNWKAGDVIHVVLLIIVALFGSGANVMTIVAVRIERRLRQSIGNCFIINLALADFLVCAVAIPIAVALNFLGENMKDNTLCYISVAISGIACHSAAVSIMFIAVNRYMATKHPTKFSTCVTRRRVIVAMMVCWTFACANTVPIMLAWYNVDYDATKYVCICFDGTFSLKYTLVPVFVGHLLPHVITIVCYIRIFYILGKSRRKTESRPVPTTNKAITNIVTDYNTEQGLGGSRSEMKEHQSVKSESRTATYLNWSSHEKQMFKISIWIIAFFSFCWIPYGILILLQELTPLILKQMFGTLCMASFSINPIIYGVMSKRFRKAYKSILIGLMCCKKNE